MATAKSTGNGPSAGVAGVASTAERSPHSARKGKRNTGSGSAPRPKRQLPLKLTRLDLLQIFESTIAVLAEDFGPVRVSNGTQEQLEIRLPRGLRICHEAGCSKLYDSESELYCDAHRGAHSTGVYA